MTDVRWHVSKRHHSRAFRRNVWVCRLVLLLFIGFLFTSVADQIVFLLGEFLLSQWWFRADAFEPILATSCFFLFITFFHVCTATEWGAATKIKQPARPMLFFKSGSLPGFGVKKLCCRSVLLYLVPLVLFDAAFPRREARLESNPGWNMPPSSAFQVFLETFMGIVVYDVVFFCCHCLLHAVPMLRTRVHGEHHRVLTPAVAKSRGNTTACTGKTDRRHISTFSLARSTDDAIHAIQPWDTVRVSPIEQAMLVASSVIAVNVTAAHPVSRALYDVVITYLLTELHCGMQWPWMLQDVVPFKLWSGSRRHYKHHCVTRNQGAPTHLEKFFGPLYYLQRFAAR